MPDKSAKQQAAYDAKRKRSEQLRSDSREKKPTAYDRRRRRLVSGAAYPRLAGRRRRLCALAQTFLSLSQTTCLFEVGRCGTMAAHANATKTTRKREQTQAKTMQTQTNTTRMRERTRTKTTRNDIRLMRKYGNTFGRRSRPRG
jgi:hypothetical protein